MLVDTADEDAMAKAESGEGAPLEGQVRPVWQTLVHGARLPSHCATAGLRNLEPRPTTRFLRRTFVQACAALPTAGYLEVDRDEKPKARSCDTLAPQTY